LAGPVSKSGRADGPCSGESASAGGAPSSSATVATVAAAVVAASHRRTLVRRFINLTSDFDRGPN
jgi:hypothetical protein